MQWIAPSEKDTATNALEKRLWDAADQLRANSGLTSAQYSTPVLGLIFLRFADVRFAKMRAALETTALWSHRESRMDESVAYRAEGVVHLTPNARVEKLLHLSESRNAARATNEAMCDIKKHNAEFVGVPPKAYEVVTHRLLNELFKRVSEMPATIDYDSFGLAYEYFLGEFARTERQKSGEFINSDGFFAAYRQDSEEPLALSRSLTTLPWVWPRKGPALIPNSAMATPSAITNGLALKSPLPSLSTLQ
ncbi:MAG: hypothetical protein LZF86_60025 [Nitrospira sp.]|nr:MAG: hypothetical protein LZF86_60025 [Nitrospira sp.]